jgi:hypothetical protein
MTTAAGFQLWVTTVFLKDMPRGKRIFGKKKEYSGIKIFLGE